ncbi:bone marrow proteoglycan-like [Anomaloglossus baeobatrachus]|uniref:bone marrow proteoglycan-like n=1 Tax=Anomaloglossus baeobatrachus TaxID=238106 RepID=UPI003F4FA751
MWRFLLLLLVGTAFAQESGESGDFDQKDDDDQLIKVPNNEVNNVNNESFDEEDDEEELDEDLSLSQEIDEIEPDFTEKADSAACPDKGTCGYHVFSQPRCFQGARRTCRHRRGNLSTLHSSQANSYLQCFLKRSVRNSSFVWIGVWKNKSCRPYRTIDGSKWNYANWGCNQRKARGRWCVAMCTRSGKWYSFRCKKRLPFVCTY